MNDAVKRLPERSGLDPGARNGFLHDEIVQDFGNLQISNRNAIESGHEKLPVWRMLRLRGRLSREERVLVHEMPPTVYGTNKDEQSAVLRVFRGCVDPT